MSKYVESTARTDRVWCTDCKDKIKKGDDVIFKLSNSGRFIAVYCIVCKKQYEQDVVHDSEHPFSSEALGQD